MKVRVFAAVFTLLAIVCVSLFPPRTSVAQVPSSQVTISLTALNQCAAINPTNGQSSGTLEVTGTHAGGVLTVYGVMPGGTTDQLTSDDGHATVTANGNYHYVLKTYAIIRACATSFSSGSFTGYLRVSAAVPPVTIASIPPVTSVVSPIPLPITCSTPCNINTPVPGPTSALGNPLVAPTELPTLNIAGTVTFSSPGPVTNTASPQPVETTLPVSNFPYYWNGTAWQPVGNSGAASPMPVITAAPAPTVSPGLLPGSVQYGPAAVNTVNGANSQIVDASGNAHVIPCSGATCPGVNTPLATPSPSPAPVMFSQQAYPRAQGTTGWWPLIFCDSTVAINTTSSGYTELVAAAAGKKIYVCSFSFQAAGTVSVKFAQGTKVSTACDTSEADITGPYPESTSTGMALASPLVPLWIGVAADELCINLNAGVGVYGHVTYTQQ